MRTALIISGQVKRLKEDAPSVITNLIEPTKPDVFVSVWQPDPSEMMELVSLYKPKAYTFEQPFTFDDVPHKVHNYSGGIAMGSKPINCWSMFYRIHHGNQMRKAYEHKHGMVYDRVIRFRFEIGVTQPLPDIQPEPNTIHIPEGQDHLGGVCDTTAIGDGPSMDVYSSIYSMLNEYSSKNMPTHQESVVRKHLELNGIRIQRFRWGTTLRGKPWNPAY